MMTHPEPGLRCLLAPNPSPMTGQGTNTYILGTNEVAVLDPGPDDPRHLQAILDATRGERITRILLSHDHHDHSDLAPALRAETGAPVLACHVAGSRVVPDIALTDGMDIAGPDWRVTALHTPGHTDDHMCFAMGGVCLTGDHVMGWASSAIIPPRGDLDDYLASLAKLARMPWRRFLSAHGDPIEDPAARLKGLATNRATREASILRLLEDGPLSEDEITGRLYRRLPDGLQRAARMNVIAHVASLCKRGIAARREERIFLEPSSNKTR